MGVTIHLEEPLASWVHTRAVTQNVSPEDFVRGLVASAREQEEPSDEWQTLNRHRMALINKDHATGLTHDEEVELEALQREADRRLEARDNELLDFVKRLRQEVETWRNQPEAS